MRQFHWIDRLAGQVAWARSCTASSEYVIVKAPCIFDARGECVPDITHLNDDDKRFVLENITPHEYAVSIGAERAEEFDRSR